VHDIVRGTNHALGLTVLRGSVGTRHPKLDAAREEESAGGGVIKLTSIIALDAPDGAVKLRGHKGKEVGEGGEGVGLLAQRKSPRVVSAVIEDDQVILVTRDTRNRGGRKVTVYEVKWLKGSNRGAGKGQPDVSTKLASITQGIISAPRAGDSWGTRQLGKDIGVGVAKTTMLDGKGSSGSQGVQDNTWTSAIVSGKHASGSKVFHRWAKRIKLYGAGVVGGETTDRNETLDKVRSYQHIVEVKWSEKYRVAYWGDGQDRTITNNDGGRVGRRRRPGWEDVTGVGGIWLVAPESTTQSVTSVGGANVIELR
jgi:hypothetical protein